MYKRVMVLRSRRGVNILVVLAVVVLILVTRPHPALFVEHVVNSVQVFIAGLHGGGRS